MANGTTREAIDVLKRKKEDLQKEKEEIIKRYDSKISTLDESIRVLIDDLDGDQRDLLMEAEWPDDASLPEKIIHVFNTIGQIMQPAEVEEYVRRNDPDLRDHAVAQSLSRMANQGRLYRKKYKGNAHHYGLPEWSDKEEDDFKDEFKQGRIFE